MPPPPPDPEPQWPIPTFNVRIEDIAHPGARIFLDNIRVDEALRHAVTTVCRLLYTEQTVPREYVLALHIRQIRRLTSVLMTPSGGCPRRGLCPASVQLITLVLRPMPGVAHTFGSPTTKEIHFSLEHIRNSESRAKDEILGVLVHEMVHCYQYDGQGKTPGGLVEGIAGPFFVLFSVPP